MTIELVTDSTCDLPPGLPEKHNIHIVPVNIQFGAETYRENVTLSAEEFYRRIEAEGVLPQTSQPSVGEFAEAYRALAGEGVEIISAHVTAKLSGTYQSACLAAERVAGEVKVHVIDGMAGSAALGWMMVEASRLRSEGWPAAKIAARLKAQCPRITIYFAVDDLKFARMSGRVGKLAGVIGSVLNIKPIIKLEDGLLDVCDRVRSRKAAVRRILDLTRDHVGDSPVRVGVVHAQAPHRAAALLAEARRALNVREAFATDVAISLAVHFGPGTLGLITYPAADR